MKTLLWEYEANPLPAFVGTALRLIGLAVVALQLTYFGWIAPVRRSGS